MSLAAANLHPSSFSLHPLDDWLPLDEAAQLTGDPVRTMRHRAAAQWASRGLAELRPPRTGRGKLTWWVHRSVHLRLDRCPSRFTREELARDSLMAQYPQAHVERAYRKAHWLRRWRQLIANPQSIPNPQSPISNRLTEHYLATLVVAEAKGVEGDTFQISVRSLQAWWTAYNRTDGDARIAGVAALVPAYSNPQSPIPNPQSPIPNRSPQAVDYFYALYHSQAKHSVRTCHDATLAESRRAGWSWPESVSATTRWLRVSDPKDETCLRREGQAVYSKKYMPHIEIDYSQIDPGHMYVADHAQLDLWCTHGAEQLRPWLTAIEDCRSRCIVGWHIGVSPNQDAIVAAMRMAFSQWAVPHRFHIDQGKDFCSELLTGVTKGERDTYRRRLGPQWQAALRNNRQVFWHGVLGELGVDVVYADPYAPWSKGQIERYFGTVHDQFDKTFATYCGNSSVARPECLAEIRRGYTNSQKRALRQKYGKAWKRVAVLKFVDQSDVPALDTVAERFAEYLELYHMRAHGGLDGDNPLSVWRTASSLRQAGETELLALMQARGVYRVQANGVSLKVGSTALTYGATCHALRRLVGRDVFITLDPADCSCCFAHTADPDSRVFIARLEANKRIPLGTSVERLREAIKNIRSRRKVMGQAAREAPRRMRDAAGEVAALRHEQLAVLKATGTDAADAQPNIAPVRTGFEAVSIPDRTPVDAAFIIADPGDLADLFDHSAPVETPDGDDDMEDLFDDAPPAGETVEETWEALS